jgi:hypothetical protein
MPTISAPRKRSSSAGARMRRRKPPPLLSSLALDRSSCAATARHSTPGCMLPRAGLGSDKGRRCSSSSATSDAGSVPACAPCCAAERLGGARICEASAGAICLSQLSRRQGGILPSPAAAAAAARAWWPTAASGQRPREEEVPAGGVMICRGAACCMLRLPFCCCCRGPGLLRCWDRGEHGGARAGRPQQRDRRLQLVAGQRPTPRHRITRTSCAADAPAADPTHPLSPSPVPRVPHPPPGSSVRRATAQREAACPRWHMHACCRPMHERSSCCRDSLSTAARSVLARPRPAARQDVISMLLGCRERVYDMAGSPREAHSVPHSRSPLSSSRLSALPRCSPLVVAVSQLPSSHVSRLV